MPEIARQAPDSTLTDTIVSSPSAYYTATIADFCSADGDQIVGILTRNTSFSVETTQRDAWVAEVNILKEAISGIAGNILLEFVVPRIGSRIDAVLIAKGIIFVIEFKVGETEYQREAINQVWDYALDLRNFHAASTSAPIVPILVATAADRSNGHNIFIDADGVHRPHCVNAEGLAGLLAEILESAECEPIDSKAWASASYQPSPTIIAAAQALYAQHTVGAISRHDAGARNLAVTSRRVEQLIEQAKESNHKIIIFVTGVPGAGKTLVGLNVATRRRDDTRPTHAVFLSGNGPLVEVLREALIRDEVSRTTTDGKKQRRGAVTQKVKAFIQNVHNFRDDALRDRTNPPADHVVIFDEAQRAWNLRKTASFMKQKKNEPNFTQSEPEFLISYLDRHVDWAVIICLVGGGQEINDGEAGISAWLEAVQHRFPHWHTNVSTNLSETEYAAETMIESLSRHGKVLRDPSLHLNISMRSFRSENVSRLVKAILDCEAQTAKSLLKEISQQYPILITRDLPAAKLWIRSQARGTERFGLVASSGAQRLKPHAIDVRYNIRPKDWFLNSADDTRSSWYLEDVATEFHVQGLELDWVLVSWDADLRFTEEGWKYRRFRVRGWINIKNAEKRKYLLNAYRVLLTRARQGMIIFVPRGDTSDATRAPTYYDSTYDYFSALGIRELKKESFVSTLPLPH